MGILTFHEHGFIALIYPVLWMTSVNHELSKRIYVGPVDCSISSIEVTRNQHSPRIFYLERHWILGHVRNIRAAVF